MNLLHRKPVRRYHILRRIIRKIAVKFLPERETYAPSWQEFTNIHDNMYISGWWESEKFFKNIADVVRKKFTFAPECFDPVLSRKVRSCNSVAVHVRRSDKVNHSSFYASDEEYIRKALEKISALTDDPEFFVFSDDINWCRENLPKIYEAHYNFIEGQTPPQDMALMTICKHVIMAPSTFSWWGAYLNDNPKKIIIAPGSDLWYVGRKRSEDSFPPGCIRID